MKRFDAKTVISLTLPVLVLLFATMFGRWRQLKSEALEVEADVKNVRVTANVFQSEPFPNTTLKRWSNAAFAEQRQDIAAGAHGLKQLIGPSVLAAPAHCIRYRVEFYIPTNLICSIHTMQAQDPKTKILFRGVGRRSRFEKNRLVAEEIFDLSGLKKCRQLQLSASLTVTDDRKSHTLTAHKIIDPTKF